MSKFIQINRVAFITIVRREITRFMRVWGQSLLPSGITMTLYFIVFGGFVGSRIGTMHGLSYAQFITPGLVMMSVITNSYTNTSTSFYLSKFQRNIEEILVAPVSNSTILLGYVAGGVLRGCMNGAIVVMISLFFTKLHIQHFVLMVLVMVLAAVIFSIAGLINAVYADSFDEISIVPTFLLTPLTYLGGVFYSVKMLPAFWQKISLFNPILYMVNAFRYGMLGYSDVHVWVSMLMMVLLAVAFYVYALLLLQRGSGLKA